MSEPEAVGDRKDDVWPGEHKAAKRELPAGETSRPLP